MKIAYVFPGQGSQVVGMGKDLAAAFPTARATFEVVNRALEWDLSRLCFEGPEDELRRTENTQPALLVTSLASLAMMREAGVRPELVAGHSVGEYAALVAAGSLDATDAARLTRLRGRLMEQACPAGTGGMAAIMGFEPVEVAGLCKGVAHIGVADLAAVNTAGQVVIAGHVRAIAECIALSKARGASSATMLPVSGPFHSSLMEPARRGLSEALEAVALRDAAMPVVTNVDGAPHREADVLRRHLVAQLVRPVLWQRTIEAMIGQGVDTFIELGSGRVLAGLIRRIDRNVAVLSVRDQESLAKTLDHLRANGLSVTMPVTGS